MLRFEWIKDKDTWTRRSKQDGTDAWGIAAVEKVCLAPNDESCPGKSNGDVCLFLSLFLSGWRFHKWFISFWGYWHFWYAVRERERWLIPRALRLVGLYKLHEISVWRTFHQCVLELKHQVIWGLLCECVVGASCCVSRHSAGNQISVLSGPACVCSVFLPRSLTLAHF